MERDHVRLREQRGQVDERDVELRGARGVDVGIVRDEANVPAGEAPRDAGADTAEADQPHGLAEEELAAVIALPPPATAQLRLVVLHALLQHQDQPHRRLGDRDEVLRRGTVRHEHAELGGGGTDGLDQIGFAPGPTPGRIERAPDDEIETRCSERLELLEGAARAGREDGQGRHGGGRNCIIPSMRALLTLIAILAVVLVAVVAYYMLVPANWDGVGKLGALALMFPLHLLAVTAVAALLIVLCWRARAHVAAVAFGIVCVVQDAMRQYIGGNPAQFPDRYLALSPASRVLPTTAPTITFLGRSDRLVPLEQAQVLDTAMRTAGATHEMWLLPAQDHAFDVNWGGFGTQFVREKVAAFLQHH